MSVATSSRLGGRRLVREAQRDHTDTGSGGIVEQPEPTSVFHARNVIVHIRDGVDRRYDRRDAKRTSMGAIESVGFLVARLLPGANASTLRRLERAAQHQTFCPRDLLHARGIQLLPFVVLDGHVMARRVAETGQVY